MIIMYENMKQAKTVNSESKEYFQELIKKCIDFNGSYSDLNHIADIRYMSYMFAEPKFNGGLSQCNISNVGNISSMFYKSNAPLPYWENRRF